MVDIRRLSRETMTGSLSRERQAANHMPTQGLGHRSDGEGISLVGASQVVDPS